MKWKGADVVKKMWSRRKFRPELSDWEYVGICLLISECCKTGKTIEITNIDLIHNVFGKKTLLLGITVKVLDRRFTVATIRIASTWPWKNYNRKIIYRTE